MAGYGRKLGARTGAITRLQNKQKNLQITLTGLEKGGIIKETKNAAGKIVNQSSVKPHGEPNSITQTVSKKGGIIRKRFCCKKSHSSYGVKIEKTNILIDTSTLKGNDKFEQILGYINTAESLQKKGVIGHAK